MKKTMKTFEKFAAVEDSMNDIILEREQVIHTALLAIASRTHHLQYGAPGIAKSYLVDVLCSHISDFGEDDLFTYKLNKFTEDNEILGHLDFFGLTKENVYRKVIKRRLPSAKIGFLDEVERASSPLLDSLNGILEERMFDTGEGPIPVPLITLYGATNALLKGSNSEAIADRFLFWHKVEHIVDPSNRAKLLRMPNSYEPQAFITLKDVYKAHDEIDKVEVTEETLESYMTILDMLKEEGVEVSDRRAKAAVKVIRSEAWFHGMSETTISHLVPLRHTLWRDVNHIDIVADTVDAVAAPFDKKCSDLRRDINTMVAAFSDALGNATESAQIEQVNNEYFTKFRGFQTEIGKVLTEIRANGASEDSIVSLKEYTQGQFNIFKQRTYGIEAQDAS